MKARSIIDAIEAVTAKYAKQRKLEERHANPKFLQPNRRFPRRFNRLRLKRVA